MVEEEDLLVDNSRSFLEWRDRRGADKFGAVGRQWLKVSWKQEIKDIFSKCVFWGVWCHPGCLQEYESGLFVFEPAKCRAKFGRQPGRKGKKAAATSACKLHYVRGRPSVHPSSRLSTRGGKFLQLPSTFCCVCRRSFITHYFINPPSSLLYPVVEAFHKSFLQNDVFQK